MTENRYPIGRFADMVGIDADTIRYYEKMGLIHSRRDHNNYRYYTDTDCRNLMTCRALRAIGFSIKQIQQGACDFEGEAFARFLKKKEAEIDRETAFLAHVKRQVNLTRTLAMRARAGGFLEISYEQESYYFFKQTDNVMLIDHQSSETLKRLMDMQPLVFRAGIVPQSELQKSPSPDSERFECGLMIEKSALTDPNLIAAADQLIEWSACGRILLSGEFGRDTASIEGIEPLMAEIARAGFRVSGDAVSRVLPSNVDAGKWYLLYSVPIEKA